jgi:hypothetical protein
MPTPGDDNPVNGPHLPILDVVIASSCSEDHTDGEPTQGIVPSHDLSTSNDDDLRFGVHIGPSSVRFGCFAVRFGIATFMHLKSVTNRPVTNLTNSA